MVHEFSHPNDGVIWVRLVRVRLGARAAVGVDSSKTGVRTELGRQGSEDAPKCGQKVVIIGSQVRDQRYHNKRDICSYDLDDIFIDAAESWSME